MSFCPANAAAGTNERVAQKCEQGRDLIHLAETSASAGAVLTWFLPCQPTQEKLYFYIVCFIFSYVKAMICVAGPSLAVENHV